MLNPDYMLNLASFQGLTATGQAQQGAESFAEILSKMPQAPNGIDSANKLASGQLLISAQRAEIQ